MLHKGKVLVVLLSTLIVLYGVSAAFYGKVVAKDDAYPALSVFMESLKTVNDDYVEPPEMSKVQEGAMQGLIDALDPYSSYLTKEQIGALDSQKGNTAEVGLVLSKRSNILYVVATTQNGPADSAGMRPGDYLVSIDGANVEDTSLLEAESMLRGTPGSKVKATVFRGSQTKPVEIAMVRANADPQPAVTRMLDGRIGFLEIRSLAATNLDQTRVKLKTLISAGAQKLLLDLRDCAGGKPEQGAELANLFIRNGPIYIVKGRLGEVLEEIKADPEKFLTDLPMAVLINGSTAGPAEIVAGALKASGRARVVGERSYGMGSVQKRIELKSGAVLILSTAKFYTPDGKLIENDESVRETGIKPDIESPEPLRLQDLLVDSYFDDQDDSSKFRQLRTKIDQEQFDRAVEVLTKGPPAEKQMP